MPKREIRLPACLPGCEQSILKPKFTIVGKIKQTGDKRTLYVMLNFKLCMTWKTSISSLFCLPWRLILSITPGPIVWQNTLTPPQHTPTLTWKMISNLKGQSLIIPTSATHLTLTVTKVFCRHEKHCSSIIVLQKAFKYSAIRNQYRRKRRRLFRWIRCLTSVCYVQFQVQLYLFLLQTRLCTQGRTLICYWLPYRSIHSPALFTLQQCKGKRKQNVINDIQCNLINNDSLVQYQWFNDQLVN